MEATLPSVSAMRFDGRCKPDAVGGMKVSGFYVESCEGGAVNLNRLNMGDYSGCAGCRKLEECRNYSSIVRELSEQRIWFQV